MLADGSASTGASNLPILPEDLPPLLAKDIACQLMVTDLPIIGSRVVGALRGFFQLSKIALPC